MAPADDASRRGAELVTTDGRALPLVATHLRAEAGGGLVRFVLEQTFVNVHEDTLRVTYKVPLPADGAVSGYAFQIGMRSITGKVDKKAKARADFEQAIADGKTAALLEQERDDVFTQEIGNIPPKETIVARITVDAPLTWLPEGEWELRFPTVIGPRYDAPPEVSIPVAPGDIGARARFEIHVHDTDIPVATGEQRLDRDIVVRWPGAARSIGVSCRSARRAGDELAYGLLTVVPPSPDAKSETVPRDLVVLLDTSGSMSGPPLAQAKKVIGMMIDSLGEKDRFELIEFSDSPRRWKMDPAPATAVAKTEALAWLRKLEAGGATEMYTGCVEALRPLRSGAQRQVVLVTDGYIGNEQALVRLLHEKLPKSCRMHVVGIGSAVNRTLATSIARAGRGAEILVGQGDDVERTAKRLFDRTGAPVLTDVTIAGDAVISCSPMHVPDVFANAPLLAAVCLKPEGGTIVVRGSLAHGTWEKKITVPAVVEGEGSEAITKLYAREHVADCEMRWTMGEGTRALDESIESTGLDFQIATRLTSWIAIDEERRVDGSVGSRHEVQPHELPYGTSLASFGLGFAAPMGMTTRAGGMSYGMVLAQPAMPMSFSAGMGAPAPMKANAPVPVMPEPTKASSSRIGLLLALFVVLLVVALLVFFLTR